MHKKIAVVFVSSIAIFLTDVGASNGDDFVVVWSENSCYGYHKNNQLSWDRSDARVSGSEWSLVKVDSQAEDQVVEDIRLFLETKNVWIGLRQNRDNRVEWRWASDGTLLDDSKWPSGDPKFATEKNQPDGDGRCVSRAQFGWMDDPCNGGRYPVYERSDC